MLLVASTCARSACLLSMLSSPVGLKRLRKGFRITRQGFRRRARFYPRKKARDARRKARNDNDIRHTASKERRSSTHDRRHPQVAKAVSAATVARSEARTGRASHPSICPLPEAALLRCFALVRRGAKRLGPGATRAREMLAGHVKGNRMAARAMGRAMRRFAPQPRPQGFPRRGCAQAPSLRTSRATRPCPMLGRGRPAALIGPSGLTVARGQRGSEWAGR